MKKEYIDYDPAGGHPAGDGLYYECVLCGGVVSSLPEPDVETCPCGNLMKDIGRLGTRIGDQGMRLVRISNIDLN